MSNFTHLDNNQRPMMVDVGGKAVTHRKATARSVIQLDQTIVAAFESDTINSAKGPVIQTAILAGIMAVKKTSDLIPLCHPLSINKVDLTIDFEQEDVLIVECKVEVDGKTGVEMEALTGASIAALTIYDMCKGLSHNIIIKETKLIHKSGGKSDYQDQ